MKVKSKILLSDQLCYQVLSQLWPGQLWLIIVTNLLATRIYCHLYLSRTVAIAAAAARNESSSNFNWPSYPLLTAVSSWCQTKYKTLHCWRLHTCAIIHLLLHESAGEKKAGWTDLWSGGQKKQWLSGSGNNGETRSAGLHSILHWQGKRDLHRDINCSLRRIYYNLFILI